VYLIIDILAGDFYYHVIDLIVYLVPSCADYFLGSRESKLTLNTDGAETRDSIAATVGGPRNSLAYPMTITAEVMEHSAYNMTLLGAEAGADYTRRQLRDMRTQKRRGPRNIEPSTDAAATEATATETAV